MSEIAKQCRFYNNECRFYTALPLIRELFGSRKSYIPSTIILNRGSSRSEFKSESCSTQSF